MATTVVAFDKNPTKRGKHEADALSGSATSLDGLTTAVASTRKTIAAAYEHGSKRRRLKSLSGGMSFLEGVNDCLLVILMFLDAEDLNSFAICSRCCHQARSAPLLDQTRTGTIVCSPNSSMAQFCDAISRGGWNDAFSGNRTHLHVNGLERVAMAGASLTYLDYLAHRTTMRLTNVTSLDLSYYNPHESDHIIEFTPCCILALILPNLRELDLGGNMKVTSCVAEVFCKGCPHLKRLTWNGPSANSLFISGQDFMDAANLTELYLDCCRFPLTGFEQCWEEEQTDMTHPDCYMLKHCRCLERVGIKDATWGHGARTQPISQAMIVKFVRHTPTLRWLLSHLTDENVSMLQNERPEITFVTE